MYVRARQEQNSPDARNANAGTGTGLLDLEAQNGTFES